MSNPEATVEIVGWKAEGMRCPDHEVDFRNDAGKVHKISLIQMPNGTGKTTTLQLLRAALSGEAREWTPRIIQSYQKDDRSSTRGQFELKLRLSQQLATIVMGFDFEGSRVEYLTTYGSGRKNGFNPPREFRAFMGVDFVNFYIFDGELAQQLLDPKQVQAEVVVEKLFQINMLPILAKKVSDHWDTVTRNRTALNKQGLTQRRNRLERITARLEQVEAEKLRTTAELSKQVAALERERAAYDKSIRSEEQRSEALSNLNATIERLHSAVADEEQEALEFMRNPHALSHLLASRMRALKNGLDRVKLPESAAREFFIELSEEAECVCERPIDDEVRAAIIRRSQQYLGTDDVALLNSIKGAIHDAIGETDAEAENSLVEKLRKLQETVGKLREVTNDRDRLIIEAGESDPALKQAKEKIDTIAQHVADLKRDLEKFDSKDEHGAEERLYGIDTLKKLKVKAEKEYAEIAETLDLREKRDVLLSIINAAHAKARTSILEAVCERANERIHALMPYNDIRIARIDKCLLLDGKDGGSAGETLSVAYAFLASLFSRAEQQLPFVVDSPAGPIDLGIRPKLGELIPQLTEQFIALTISSERQGFVPSLKASCQEEIQFVTLFKKGSRADVDDKARGVHNHRETLDGLLVLDEKFFSDFQDIAEVS